YAVNIDGDRRRVTGRRIPRHRRAPHRIAIDLVERDDRSLPSPRRADEVLAVDQHRFADAPGDVVPAELAKDVLRPADGAALGIHADEIATGSQGIEVIAVDRR